MANRNLEVQNITIQEDMYYKDVIVLSYKIEYPQFLSPKFNRAANRINRLYKMEALMFWTYCRHNLFKLAVEDYRYSEANGYPVRAYEAVQIYEITYNQDCTLSLYFDRYEYTAGAHGNTTRYSDTWDLQSGRRVPLAEFFTLPGTYKEYMIHFIYEQIEKQMAQGEHIYFDDYKKNVADQFDENNFYLTPDGIVIYFQQYEIGPYSSGILQFTIPYSEKVKHPACL